MKYIKYISSTTQFYFCLLLNQKWNEWVQKWEKIIMWKWTTDGEKKIIKGNFQHKWKAFLLFSKALETELCKGFTLFTFYRKRKNYKHPTKDNTRMRSWWLSDEGLRNPQDYLIILLGKSFQAPGANNFFTQSNPFCSGALRQQPSHFKLTSLKLKKKLNFLKFTIEKKHFY